MWNIKFVLVLHFLRKLIKHISSRSSSPKIQWSNMSKVHITNVAVLDNPSSFYNPFQFELTFECIEELKEDLEWKMIYVGSAESEEYDQVLDTVSWHCNWLWNFVLMQLLYYRFYVDLRRSGSRRTPHFRLPSRSTRHQPYSRTGCSRCDHCVTHVFLSRTRIRSCWLLHKQRLLGPRIAWESSS